MASPDNIEARVNALETEVREEIRDFRHATTSSFNAMPGQEQIVNLLNTVIARQAGE